MPLCLRNMSHALDIYRHASLWEWLPVTRETCFTATHTATTCNTHCNNLQHPRDVSVVRVWHLSCSHTWIFSSVRDMCHVHTHEHSHVSSHLNMRHIDMSHTNNLTCRGYRNSARLLGESCWQKKLWGHSGKKFAQKSRNSCTVNGWGCGCRGTVESRRRFAQPKLYRNREIVVQWMVAVESRRRFAQS